MFPPRVVIRGVRFILLKTMASCRARHPLQVLKSLLTRKVSLWAGARTRVWTVFPPWGVSVARWLSTGSVKVVAPLAFARV